jgi:hypothetical protein
MMVSVTDESFKSNKLMYTYYNKNVDTNLRFTKKWDEEEESPNYDKLLLARNLFDLNELKKSAHILKDQSRNIND